MGSGLVPNPFCEGFRGFCEGEGNGAGSNEEGRGFGVGPSPSSGSAAALVLDEERCELVINGGLGRGSKKALVGGGNGALDAKAAMALRSHSEAERRRRERINGHLATLRSMVPCTDKLDKAALLAEVISHVKKLKSSAVEISKDCSIPSDVDEVRVEVDGDGMKAGKFCIKASLCCEDRPDLLADLRQTLQSLKLKTVRAEISSLGGRVKNVFVMTCEGRLNDMEQHLFTTNVHHALKSVLDRATSSEFVPRTPFYNKRRRISPFESSCSSS